MPRFYKSKSHNKLGRPAPPLSQIETRLGGKLGQNLSVEARGLGAKQVVE